MTQGGLNTPITQDIRQEIWIKLAANVALNQVGALVRATTSEMCDDPSVYDLLCKIMSEVQAVAASLGFAAPLAPEQILSGANQSGTHKTSMLQDLERGRPLEIDALSGAVRELARLKDVDIPNIDIIHHLISLKAQTTG
jgi:2-dehydropantoate 2-reductase